MELIYFCVCEKREKHYDMVNKVNEIKVVLICQVGITNT